MAEKPFALLHLASLEELAKRLMTEGNKPEKKRRSLIRLGVPHGQAYAWSRTRMGGWAVAQSPILGTTITIKVLKKRGYVPVAELFNTISPNYKNSLFPVI